MRRLPLLLAVVALVGCGGGSSTTTTTRASAPSGGPVAAMQRLIRTDPALRGTVRMLFEASGWAVVESASADHASAFAFHLRAGAWTPDRSRQVTIAILGPQPGAHAVTLPQVAMEITAHKPFVESALWVDGTELEEKGGGSPANGTIYGAPLHKLKPGLHVAVGYARTAASGSAVAWTFRVG